jgi:hypothetical protein
MAPSPRRGSVLSNRHAGQAESAAQPAVISPQLWPVPCGREVVATLLLAVTDDGERGLQRTDQRLQQARESGRGRNAAHSVGTGGVSITPPTSSSLEAERRLTGLRGDESMRSILTSGGRGTREVTSFTCSPASKPRAATTPVPEPSRGGRGDRLRESDRRG